MCHLRLELDSQFRKQLQNSAELHGRLSVFDVTHEYVTDARGPRGIVDAQSLSSASRPHQKTQLACGLDGYPHMVSGPIKDAIASIIMGWRHERN
jgi:hypothetical protein